VVAGWRRPGVVRWASIALAAIVILTNPVSLGLLVSELASKPPSGGSLLLAAMQIWVTNVIGFGLLFDPGHRGPGHLTAVGGPGRRVSRRRLIHRTSVVLPPGLRPRRAAREPGRE
jgi:hypothetical protein